MNRRTALIMLVLSLFVVSVAQAQRVPAPQVAPRVPVGGGCCLPITDARDGGFEGTTSGPLTNPDWTSESFAWGTPLCTNVECVSASAGPDTGTDWVWFGGTTGAESAYVEQYIVIPDNGEVGLTFRYWISAYTAAANPVFSILIDGAAIPTEDLPLINATTAGYISHYSDITNFADGEPHLVRFNYTQVVSGTFTNLSIDNIALNKGEEFPISNANFDFGTPPWTQTGNTGDRVKCNTPTKTFSYGGNCAFVFKGGAGENSALKQSYFPLRSVPPAPGRAPLHWSVYLGAFVKAKPSATGKMSFKLTFDDATKLKGKVSLAGTSAYWWKQTPPKLYDYGKIITKVQVTILHTSTGGKVLVDNLEMFQVGVYF